MTSRYRDMAEKYGIERPLQGARVCDHPDCGEDGDHRAPRSREKSDPPYWFCLNHVRAYNASWNYYDGMTDDEVEADLRRDTTWHRPTWRLGTKRTIGLNGSGVVDDFGILGGTGGGGDHGPADSGYDWPGFHANTPEAQALAVLDLRPPLGEVSLKARYKALAKRHHPDANGGDKGAEERFKRITEAYNLLRMRLAS